MKVSEDSTSGTRFARASKQLMEWVGVPIAAASICAILIVLSYRLSFSELFLSIVIGWTPYIAALLYGSSFGRDLYVYGWRRMLFPLLRYLSLITLLYLPFLLLDSTPARFLPPYPIFVFVAFLAFAMAWQHALWGTPSNPRPWTRTRL